MNTIRQNPGDLRELETWYRRNHGETLVESVPKPPKNSDPLPPLSLRQQLYGVLMAVGVMVSVWFIIWVPFVLCYWLWNLLNR